MNPHDIPSTARGSIEVDVLRAIASENASTAVAEDAQANENMGSRGNEAVLSYQSPWATSWRLYLSHFLSTWNSRSFEFAAFLILATAYPDTLRYASIYALSRSAAAIVSAPSVGNAIDRRPRLQVVRFSIIAGRLAVIMSMIGMWSLITFKRIPHPANGAIFAGLILVACLEKSVATLNLISIERDWVVVVAGDHAEMLQKLNARMRRIDLFCKLVGPLAIGLIDGASTAVAIWVLIGSNIVSLPIEYFAIAQVHRRVPALSLPKPTVNEQSDEAPRRHRVFRATKAAITGFQRYFEHPACLPSFALALLYLTVLSFSGQMITYLVSVGLKSYYVTLIRSLSTVFELSATWLAPRAILRIGPIRAASWFLNWQVMWLAASIALFWSEPSALVVACGLSAGTILSRVGLWGFDLGAQSIIQTEVQGDIRGSFSSTEAAFQNAFEMVSYALTIALPRPDQFKYPVLVSGLAVCCAGMLYAKFLRRRRGHLLHASCFKPPRSGGHRDW